MTATSLRPVVPEAVRHDILAALEVAEGFPAADAAGLAEVLYADWYLGRTRGGPEELPLALGPLDLCLPDLLRDAHVDARRWEAGWTVEGVSSQGRIAVAREGSRRVLARVDVLPVARTCLPPRPGDAVRVVARRDTLDEASAFWFAYGGDWDESSLPPGLVRIYWNIPRRSTPALVAVLTDRLAGAGPYSLKVAVEDRDIERSDRAVLYLTRDTFAVAAGSIRRAHRALVGELLPRVPRLTRRLATGLALADDPGTGESFGQHACRLVAEGIRANCMRAATDPNGRAANVVEHLAAAGVDPARPYLRPGSGEDHPWPST